MSHEIFMRRAIVLSREQMERGSGGPFGAVIVKDGVIIAEGWNRVTSANDPTAHAEIVAIRAACAALGDFRLGGCEIYASCEPCPMCYAAAYWARVAKIYYAAAWADCADLFDDQSLGQEMKKPYAERKLTAEPLLRSAAQKVWAEFRKLPDRTRY